MRILVIEDQVKLANSLKKGLEQHSYAVDVLYDGEEGLKRIEYSHAQYDLVILDIMLPRIDGLTICKTTREKHITTPILMLTAKDTLEDRVMGLNSGADDYLVKPFAFLELMARVAALLRRPKESLAPTICVGDITLNTVMRQVVIRGDELSLTTKQFAILELFMRNPNQIITRDFILSHVWDFASDTFSNIIDAHIKNLRKKLQKSHATTLETIHGQGYRLKA